jgi:hypothetical protein
MKTKLIDNDILIPEIGKLIAQGHTVTMTVKGNSMRPFVEGVRDKALLVACHKARVGDAVLAHVDDGRFVLHRIIKKEGTKLTLMGDGNLVGTETCDEGDVIARVEGFIRKGRNRIDRTDGIKWRIYSAMWPQHHFMRRILLAVYRRFILKTVNTA